MTDKNKNLLTEIIENRIYYVRGYKVMLDSDLAKLYQVETKVLNQAVKRNIYRFPDPEFMFQLNNQEVEVLRSQFVTSKGKGGRRYLPFVFSEYGILMLFSKQLRILWHCQEQIGRIKRLVLNHRFI